MGGYAGYGQYADANFFDPSTSLSHQYYYAEWLFGIIATCIHILIIFPMILNNVNRSIERLLPDKFSVRMISRTIITCVVFGLASTPVSNFANMIPFVQSPPVMIIQAVVPIAIYWTLFPKLEGGFKQSVKNHPIKFAYHVFALMVIIIAIIFGMWTSIDQYIADLKS